MCSMKGIGMMMTLAGIMMSGSAFDPTRRTRNYGHNKPTLLIPPTTKIPIRDIPKGHKLYRESFTCLVSGRDYVIMAEFTACNQKGYIAKKHKKSRELLEYCKNATDQERLDLGYVYFERIIVEKLDDPNIIIVG